MANLTKKQIVDEIIKLGGKDDKSLMRETKAELIRILDIKKINKKENEKMPKTNQPKFELKKDFFIGQKDCVQHKWGKKTKAKEAVPAVPAIEEKFNDEGELIQGAMKAVPAKPAVKASTEMYMRCLSREIAEQFIARMQDQGLEPNYDGDIFEEDFKGETVYTVAFAHEDIKVVRAAMKAAKSKSLDGYNGVAMKDIKAKAAALKKEKAAAKAAAKAEKAAALAEAEEKPKTKKKAAPKKSAPKKEELPSKDTDDEFDDDGWPGEELEE